MRIVASPVTRLLSALLLLLAPACGGGGGGGGGDTPPAFFSFSTFQDADLVLGQADFTSNNPNRAISPAANSMARPGKPCLVGGLLFVPDGDNHRVLGWNAMPTTDGQAADFVLGQTSLTGASANQGAMDPAADTLAFPWAVSSAGGRLFVADTQNQRVLIYNTLPTSTGAAADLCVGQADLTSTVLATTATGMRDPAGIHAVGSRLLVCDVLNHRVMIWNTIPTASGAACDIVLGQATKTAGSANRGNVQPAANSLSAPYGVWSDGTRVVVADGGNHRVLIWNSFPTTDGQAADLVLGQASFTTNVPATTALGLRIPTDVTSDGTKLVIGDCENNRIVIHDAFPVASNTAPTTVLGQGVFTLGAPNDDNQDGFLDGVGNGTCTARTMNTASGFAYVALFGTRLFSGDHRNHRVVVYNGQ